MKRPNHRRLEPSDAVIAPRSACVFVTSHREKANGTIRVVVYETTKLQATYNPTPNNATGFLLGYLGQQTVYVETQFRGTLVVPNASLNLRALNGVSHEGEFYAKDLKTEGGATVRHVPAACALP